MKDEEEGKQYENILRGKGMFFFESPDSFRYIALRGNKLYLVEE